MLTVKTPKRGSDTWGSGAFGASRGKRNHMGIDYSAAEGSILCTPVTGHVTKLGYCYGDDLSYRYVQIKDQEGNRHRLFYVEPDVVVGDEVVEGDEIGEVQNIVRRYPTPKGMKNHVHYEIIDTNELYVNPDIFWGK